MVIMLWGFNGVSLEQSTRDMFCVDLTRFGSQIKMN